MALVIETEFGDSCSISGQGCLSFTSNDFWKVEQTGLSCHGSATGLEERITLKLKPETGIPKSVQHCFQPHSSNSSVQECLTKQTDDITRTHTHTHTHLYMCVCACVFIHKYISKSVNIYVYFHYPCFHWKVSCGEIYQDRRMLYIYIYIYTHSVVRTKF